MGALSNLISAAESFPIRRRGIEGVETALVRIPGAPGLSIVFGLRDGPAYEPDGWWGISHFAALLAEGGTAAYPSAYAVRRAVESVGGALSRVSRRDAAGFQVKVPAGSERRALEVLTELLTRPAIDEEHVESVRGLIIRDRETELERPARAARLLLESLLLSPAPASRHPEGGEEFVQAADPVLLSDYVRGIHHRGNLSVAVAGGFSDAFEDALSAALAAFPEGLGRRKPEFEVPDPAGGNPAVFVAAGDPRRADICLGWNVPIEGPDDALSLRLVDTLLGSGRNALLRRRLEDSGAGGWACRTSLTFCGDAGLFRVALGGPAEGAAGARDAVESVFSELASGRIGPDLVRDAANRTAAEMLFRFEDPARAAEPLAAALCRGETPTPLAREIEALEKLPSDSTFRLASHRLLPVSRKAVLLSGAKGARGLFPDAAVLSGLRGGRAALI